MDDYIPNLTAKEATDQEEQDMNDWMYSQELADSDLYA
jgi:hypothetical protein